MKNYVINGEVVDVTTVMDKSVTFVPTREVAEEIKDKIYDLLNEYFPGYLHKAIGINDMFAPDGVFWERKGWLWDAFSKHPNWNGKGQIVLRGVNMKRHIDYSEAMRFFRYVYNVLDTLTDEQRYDYTYNGGDEIIPYAEGKAKLDKLTANRVLAERLYYHYRNKDKYNIADKVVEAYRRLYGEINKYHLVERYNKELSCLSLIKEKIKYDREYIVSDFVAEKINEIMGDPRFTSEGTKFSRLVGKLCKRMGINKHVDIQTVSFTRQDGTEVTRTVDKGYNKQFAAFGDAINPLSVKATAVISVNPMDYYTMSFGKSWASCQTIDKNNRRGCENSYHGMYCSGTESYMLDNSTVIMYYIPDDYEGNPENSDKLKRCVFYLGEDKVIQGRVYPDGRDGGDNSLAGDMRKLMCKVVSEVFETPNFWKYKGDTSACESVIYSDGTHYRDYENYSDCGVAYMKRIDGYINNRHIDVGSDPICPECGKAHTLSSELFCYDCGE